MAEVTTRRSGGGAPNRRKQAGGGGGGGGPPHPAPNAKAIFYNFSQKIRIFKHTLVLIFA